MDPVWTCLQGWQVVVFQLMVVFKRLIIIWTVGLQREDLRSVEGRREEGSIFTK